MPELELALVERLGPNRALWTPDALLAYECDGFTMHKVRPRAVALPETTEEVQWIVRTCRQYGVPFVPRGAGTCLSGGPTPTEPSVVIETSRMKRVLEVDEDDQIAVVQPGVVNLALTQSLCEQQMHYAPDPSSQAVCTIGGNLAENAGGPHCFKYGMTTDHILGAKIVLSDGSIAELGGTAAVRAPHEWDLIGLFTGSEGTFGIAVEITVRICPNNEGVRTMLGSFASMADACGAVSDIVAAGMVPAAMEILDQATIRAVEASVYRAGYPQDAEAVLLVEIDGPEIELEEEAAAIVEMFRARRAIEIESADDPATRKRLWKGRKGAFGAMGRLNTDLYVLDGVVPRTKLMATLDRINAIGEQHGLKVINFFHAGDGNLHPNLSYDGRDPDQCARVEAAGYEILKTCVEMGGSITGEHGIGTEKLSHVPLMFTEDDLDVMRRVREAFDPDGVCNPGKVLPERASCAEVAKWPKMAAMAQEERSE